MSFQEGSELLQELAGVALDPIQVERTAERLGREIAHDERSVVTPEPPSAPTMYLGLDGTGVPMRASEAEGRQGKQPGGTAKTREVKLVTVWSAEGRDDQRIPVRDRGSVSYSAAIESAAMHDTDLELSPFAQRVQREARRRSRRHHLPAMRPTQRSIRRLLATPDQDPDHHSHNRLRSSPHKSVVRPSAGSGGAEDGRKGRFAKLR